MDYLAVLLLCLTLDLPDLTGKLIPALTDLPAIEVSDDLGRAVLAHTGQTAGWLTTGAYLPRENVILIQTPLLDDTEELKAIIVHELVHWVQSLGPDRYQPQVWEAEARSFEKKWRTLSNK